VTISRNRCQPANPSPSCPAQLDEATILRAAVDSGFMKRKPRKIPPLAFLAALCHEALRGSPSYNDLAAAIGAASGISASRQSMAERMGPPCLVFLQALLEHVMGRGVTPAQAGHAHPTGRYLRVLVQDSTVIQLPAALFEAFSGVANGHASACNARIQAVYDLASMRFSAFSIDPYSKNDQKAAPDLEIRAGDLVLRDRGYLANGEITRHVEAGADCIYRHSTRTIYLDAVTGLPVALLDHLRRHGHADMPVLLNNPARTRVRLVAAPVDPATAATRRMRAKKEMRGHAATAGVLALMDWTIFITTIPATDASFEAILAIYGMRWRIEVIFKSWKSHLEFATVHRLCETQLRILLTARLMLVAAWANNLYGPCSRHVRDSQGRELSLLKFIRHLARHPQMAGSLARMLAGDTEHEQQTLRAVARYCCYDKRKRPNFNQIWDSLGLT
jgi:hypothetical protein